MLGFKFMFGNEENLPDDKTFGRIYCCFDSGNLFFDFINSVGALCRMRFNAEKAEKLRYTKDGVEHELLPQNIATKEDVTQKIATSQGVANDGKILAVGDDGNVAPMKLSTIGGTLTWGDLVNNT